MPSSEPRVALVHDFLLDLRGAERVFLVLCEMFPQADIFTAVYDPVGTEGRFEQRNVHTSFLQRLRPNATSFRRLLPLYPYAMEALDLSGYDLVLSSSSAWAHGVLPSPDAVHVCYCHNPFRYAWNARETTLRTQRPIVRPALSVVLARWRQWDWIAAQRVDRYIANSETTRRRVARYFTREADVVYPPVEVERFAPGAVGEHYAVLSELMPHKRIELAVRAFNELGRPLVVIGDGPDARRLQRLAGPTVRFTGRVSDAEVARLLATARALVVTATEEFGIAAVEAQAAGRPVIALDEGGVTESVQEGRTGVFYDVATPEALAAAVAAFDPLSVDPADCVANAQRFSVDAFAQEIRAIVSQALAAGPSPRGDRRRPARGLALAGRRAA
jgi:glycosyltransferase involved in cell wall biosynthesis